MKVKLETYKKLIGIGILYKPATRQLTFTFFGLHLCFIFRKDESKNEGMAVYMREDEYNEEEKQVREAFNKAFLPPK